MNHQQTPEYAATVADGRVAIHNVRDGSLKRAFYISSQSAIVSGNTAHVTRTDGHVEIYDIDSGALIRRI